MKLQGRQTRRILLGTGALLLVAAAVLWTRYNRITLNQPEILNGYLLFGCMWIPALLGLRKKLSMLPIGSAARWTEVHVLVGVVLLPLYWLHTGAFWPTGGYEKVLAGLFYLVSISGLFGWFVQSTYPARLTQLGREIQFERIPAAICDLRDEALVAIRQATEDTATDTLARHYVQGLSWYFFKPRFVVNHLVGGQRHEYWLQGQFRRINRYLGPREKQHMERLQQLARQKSDIDAHYAIQGLLKLWLFLHIPASVALLGLAVWHLLLVHIYSI